MYKNRNNLSAKYNKQISLPNVNYADAFSINFLHILEATQYQWRQQENLPNFSSSAVSSVRLSTHLPEDKKCYMSGMSPVMIF